uniref:Vegetative cell wall protein gp1-like n=1 Tax=Parastrongyloides trichosuri TaxID=131310 RepID=A0A0N5A5Y0_PARTI
MRLAPAPKFTAPADPRPCPRIGPDQPAARRPRHPAASPPPSRPAGPRRALHAPHCAASGRRPSDGILRLRSALRRDRPAHRPRRRAPENAPAWSGALRRSSVRAGSRSCSRRVRPDGRSGCRSQPLHPAPHWRPSAAWEQKALEAAAAEVAEEPRHSPRTVPIQTSSCPAASTGSADSGPAARPARCLRPSSACPPPPAPARRGSPCRRSWPVSPSRSDPASRPSG